MDSVSARRRGTLSFVAGATIVLLIALAAVPLPPIARGFRPSSFPPGPHRLVSNNLKTGDTLRLDLLTLPQSAIWVLASSNSGPSYIGTYLTDLGPDWFVLQGPVLMGGGSHLQLTFPVPLGAGLAGLEFAVQCAAVSPLAPDVAFSNGVALRVSQGSGKNVLLLRQTTSAAGMANAAAQADALAIGLQLLGNHVTVADDVLPLSLLDHDCILDLRFTTPPAADEAARFVQFLRTCGGAFFVCGPYAGCPEGQQRAAWLESLLNGVLGVGVAISSGGNLSGASVETIDPAAGPEFLSASAGITGLTMDVTHEGGSFGPPGAPGGTPWLGGSTALGPRVYGMFFDPSAMSAETVGGRLAVLFAGGASTFLPTAASPYPDLIMGNVAHYLDR
jgi:hypothetical protein